MNLGNVLLTSRNPQNYFYQCVPGGFSYLSNKLEQFNIKLEKIIGIEKHAGKIRKTFLVQLKQSFGPSYVDRA